MALEWHSASSEPVCTYILLGATIPQAESKGGVDGLSITTEAPPSTPEALAEGVIGVGRIAVVEESLDALPLHFEATMRWSVAQR